MIAGVVIVGMVANALLCNRGRSYAVLPEVELISYDSGSMNSMEGEQVGEVSPDRKARPMQHKKSDRLIVAMIDKPMIHRTCAAGGDDTTIKLDLAKGS